MTEVQAAGRLLDDETLRFVRMLPVPVDHVWAYLTEPGRRATWLAGGRMELRPGGEVELRFRHADLSEEKEPIPERYREMEGGDVMQGTVLASEPPRLLRFTWAENRERSSEVTFELEPQEDLEPREDKVLLIVTHRGLEGRRELISVASGWHTHLDILAERLRGAEPRPFWARHLVHEREYERLIPQRSEF